MALLSCWENDALKTGAEALHSEAVTCMLPVSPETKMKILA